MTSLTSLIERIEAATEGGRELDAEIWLACTPGATRDKWSYIHKATGRECTVDETRDATDRLIIVPSYTTSIDAVRTLIPPPTECWWLIEQLRSPDSPMASFGIPGIFRARVGFWRSSSNYIARHDDPTLALLTAILRARQTEVHNG